MADKEVDITAEWRAIDPLNADQSAQALMCLDDDEDRKPRWCLYAVRVFHRLGGYTDLHRVEADEIFGPAMIAELERRADDPLPVTE